MPAPGDPPGRWMCPRCRGIIEETTYFGLHRTLVRGPGGKYTQIECPICGRLTVGAEWTVVGVIGTEEIT